MLTRLIEDDPSQPFLPRLIELRVASRDFLNGDAPLVRKARLRSLDPIQRRHEELVGVATRRTLPLTP